MAWLGLARAVIHFLSRFFLFLSAQGFRQRLLSLLLAVSVMSAQPSQSRMSRGWSSVLSEFGYQAVQSSHSLRDIYLLFASRFIRMFA